MHSLLFRSRESGAGVGSRGRESGVGSREFASRVESRKSGARVESWGRESGESGVASWKSKVWEFFVF
jgi:hypothetical protein